MSGDATLRRIPMDPELKRSRAEFRTAFRWYEIYVDGLHAEELVARFPALRVRRDEDLLVLAGTLDETALRDVLRRLREFGWRVYAVFDITPRY